MGLLLAAIRLFPSTPESLSIHALSSNMETYSDTVLPSASLPQRKTVMKSKREWGPLIGALGLFPSTPDSLSIRASCSN